MIMSTGGEYNAWLQPCRLDALCKLCLVCDDNVSEVVKQECIEGFTRIYGDVWDDEAKFTISISLNLITHSALSQEGFCLEYTKTCFKIRAHNNSGALYGLFTLFRELSVGKKFEDISLAESPVIRYRVINHWDSIEGKIERGYAGRSIFFNNNRLDYDPERIRDYARLLASIGVNIISINNVNVTPISAKLITNEMLPDVKALTDIFREYGVRLALAVHFESPVMLGVSSTADPLDELVVKWWGERVKEIYSYIPDFAGFIVKADSEFNNGPQALGRTQADGANMLARALSEYGGIVFWRCFIYNC
ncbi:MAG: hypothetical protein LBQ68_07175, partial [Clostridiales bacterium]|nr:hypothetical protein [Clostridiales bacterium]